MMPATNTATSYGQVARTLHWLTALLILTAMPLGIIANDAPFATGAELAAKAQLFSLHKTVGIAAFAVALIRILWALTQTRPEPIHPDRRWETRMAEVVHWTLYLSLVIVPLSGWVHHAATDGFAPILWPLGQDLPLVPTSDTVAKTAAALHWLFTKILFASIALHILGALKHALIDRDGTLARMVTGRPAPARPTGTGHRAAPALAAVAIYAAGAVAALSLVPAAPTAVAPAPAGAAAGNWQVTQGTLALTVRQMGAEVAGTLPFAAAITFDDTSGTGTVTVTLDTANLTLGSVSDQAKGPEFFDIAAHPAATYTATIAPAGDAFAATGTLTLRGVAVPVTLPFTLTIDGDTAQMAGTVTLDRRDFGMGPSYPDESTVGFAVQAAVTLTATRP
jgi:cytochrome b561/polyisoprenoid-binding protein YceI